MNIECPHCKQIVEIDNSTYDVKATCPKCEREINLNDFSIESPVKTRLSPWTKILFVLATGLFVLVAVPNFMKIRTRAYDASAKSAGRNAKRAQEFWPCEHGGDISGGYKSSLAELLSYDRNLTEDAYVTFIFGDCDISGYTYTTYHAKGNHKFVFTD